jgi:uncharacterized ParB-like nuclease family protein
MNEFQHSSGVDLRGPVKAEPEPAFDGSKPEEVVISEEPQGQIKGEVRRIPLRIIKVDPAIQQRVAGTSQEIVEEYAQAMRAGAAFPAIDVFGSGDGTFYVADGFHRLEAHRRNQEQEVECHVHHGDRDDAILFACGANAGLRRSPSDQRKAVSSLVSSKTWSQWSDREIARRCKVSPTLVAKVRKGHLQTAFIDGGQREEGAGASTGECTRTNCLQRAICRYDGGPISNPYLPATWASRLRGAHPLGGEARKRGGAMTRIAAVRMFTLKTGRNSAVHTAAPITTRSSRSAHPSPGTGRHRHRTLPEGTKTSLFARRLWLDERPSNFQKLRTRWRASFPRSENNLDRTPA